MINKKTRTVEEEYIESITCDICNSKFTSEDSLYYEMFHIQKTCGYFSRFTDQSIIYLNICDSCFYNMFKDKVNIFDEEHDE
jgi:uncharacterized protein (DUF2225 family)